MPKVSVSPGINTTFYDKEYNREEAYEELSKIANKYKKDDNE